MILGEPEPLDDNSPCPINGKYHNIPLGKVPASFLDWFLGQPHLMRKYPQVVKYCQIPSIKRAIAQDLPEPLEDFPEEDFDPNYPPRRFYDDEA